MTVETPHRIDRIRARKAVRDAADADDQNVSAWLAGAARALIDG